jgi:hypothetical protein
MAGTGVTTKDDLFIPEVLADAVGAEFAGMTALYDTGAAIVNSTMPYGRNNLGEEIKIPYFELIGELEDLNTDGAELSPAKLTSTNELATVLHSGKGVEFTLWAQLNPTDPYGEGARQVRMATTRRADKALIDAASNTTGMADYTVDVFNATTPNKLDYDDIVIAMGKLGDEGFGERPAALVVHSKVFGDMRLDKDADGKPKLVTTPAGRGLPVVDTLGIPIIVSDKMPVTKVGGVNKYLSLLVWPGALVFWINGTPLILEESNARKPSDGMYLHIWHATHRYKHRRGGTKPGVVHLFTN